MSLIQPLKFKTLKMGCFKKPHLQMVVGVASGQCPRLYIDRLAHWRCSLVDPQLEIQALAAVPKAFLNYTSRESRNLSFNLG